MAKQAILVPAQALNSTYGHRTDRNPNPLVFGPVPVGVYVNRIIVYQTPESTYDGEYELGWVRSPSETADNLLTMNTIASHGDFDPTSQLIMRDNTGTSAVERIHTYYIGRFVTESNLYVAMRHNIISSSLDVHGHITVECSKIQLVDVG